MGQDDLDTSITPAICALIVHRQLRLIVFLFGAREKMNTGKLFSLLNGLLKS